MNATRVRRLIEVIYSAFYRNKIVQLSEESLCFFVNITFVPKRWHVNVVSFTDDQQIKYL